MYPPEGVIGEMGQRIREKIASSVYGNALMTGVRAFVDRLGEEHSFDFAALDPQRGENIAQAQRPRTVQSPVSEPSENPQPTPTTPEAASTATPEASATPAASIEARAEASPTVSPATESTPTPEPSATAAAVPTVTASP